MPRANRRESLAVEPGDQVGHRVATPAAGGPGRLLVVGAVRNGQEHDGAGDVNCWCGVAAAQAGQFLALVVGQRVERILPAAGHGNSQRVDTRRVATAMIMATGEATDPLVPLRSLLP